MREVVEQTVTKRAKDETSARGTPNPVESLGSCSRATAVTWEDKMLTRTDILDEIICRVGLGHSHWSMNVEA